jgi:AraC-like DNA-binding protein
MRSVPGRWKEECRATDEIATTALPPAIAGAFDVVHAQILRFFPDLVEELGGNPQALLAHVGLDLQEIVRGYAGATYRQMIDLLELASLALRCPDLGMRLATLQGGAPMFGPLGQVMRNSPSFGDALAYVSAHSYAHSLAAGIWLKQLATEKAVFVAHDILLDRPGNRAQTIEQMLLVGNLAAMELTGGYARAKRVHFRHQPVCSLKTYRRYFGCEVLFGQHGDGLVFSEWTLSCPIIDADAQAYHTAAAYVRAEFTRQRPPLHAQARGVILHLVGTNLCTNARVAHELKLHPRTLHRRLAAEGTSFHQIKDEVRRDLALYYFQKTDLDFSSISERLGFAEQAVMTRRCNRWFAAAPTKVRQRGARAGVSADHRTVPEYDAFVSFRPVAAMP